MKLIVIVAACVLGGCSSYQLRPDEYRLTMVDDKLSEAFHVSLESKRRAGDICIDTASWPNSLGFMDGANTRVKLMIDGRAFIMKPFNEGYCPGGCKLSVAPGATLSASVPYASFGIPRDLYEREKQLSFPLVIWKCEHR